MSRLSLAIAMTFVLAFAGHADAKSHRHHHRHYYRTLSPGTEVGEIVSHPAGCPRVAFCGCGASVEVFGHPIRDLYLASNWFRFPHASPAPGMVAVRQHHVFVIRSVNGDGTVVAYDANSGGHATRVHTVSLAGYSVRDPRGGGDFSLSARSHHGGRYAATSPVQPRFGASI